MKKNRDEQKGGVEAVKLCCLLGTDALTDSPQVSTAATEEHKTLATLIDNSCRKSPHGANTKGSYKKHM